MTVFSILGFLLVIFFGYLVVNLFLEKENVLEKLALGFIVGFGLFTYILFLIALRGIKFSPMNFSLILALSCSLFVLINKLFRHKIFSWTCCKSSFKKLCFLAKISFFWIGLVFVSLAIYDAYWPMRGMDAYILYDFRAKLFATTGVMDNIIKQMNFFAYPLMTSLSHTWLYFLGFDNPMFFYFLFFIAFVTLFYFNLRKILDVNFSLIFTAIFCCFPDFYAQAQVAYLNLPYCAYLVLGSFYLYLGIKQDKKSYFFISMILTALSGWVRSVEPFWMINVLIALLYGVIRPRKFPMAVLYSLFNYFFRAPWNNFFHLGTRGSITARTQIIGGTTTFVQAVTDKADFSSVANYFFRYAILPYFILYILCLVMLILKMVHKKNDWWFFLILWGSFMLLLLGTCVFSLGFSDWSKIPTSFQREVIFLIPMMIFFIAISFREVYEDFWMIEKNSRVGHKMKYNKKYLSYGR